MSFLRHSNKSPPPPKERTQLFGHKSKSTPPPKRRGHVFNHKKQTTEPSNSDSTLRLEILETKRCMPRRPHRKTYKGLSKFDKQGAGYVDKLDKTRIKGKWSRKPTVGPFDSIREDSTVRGHYALTLHHFLNEDGNLVSLKVIIKSHIIWQTIERFHILERGILASSSDLIKEDRYSFPWLLRHRDQIRAYAEAPDRTEEEKAHLSLITELLFERYLEREGYQEVWGGKIFRFSNY